MKTAPKETLAPKSDLKQLGIVNRVETACLDMSRIFQKKEGVVAFINGIRNLLYMDYSFALESGGVVLEDSEQEQYFSTLLANCRALRNALAPLRIDPVTENFRFDTRSMFLLADASFNLNREKYLNSIKSKYAESHLSLEQLEVAVQDLGKIFSKIKCNSQTEQLDVPENDGVKRGRLSPFEDLPIFFQYLDALTETLDFAVTKYKISRGSTSGKYANNIVKARLAKKFVDAYTKYFGEYPPKSNAGPTVDAFQMLCEAAAFPQERDPNKATSVSYALIKATRSRIAYDERTKNYSDILEKMGARKQEILSAS